MRKKTPQIVTKSLPTNGVYNSLPTTTANNKFTRLVWWTHNDFHNHKFWEICLVLSGKGAHHFLTHTEDMHVGTMWLLRPNDVHMIEPLNQENSPNSYMHRDIYIEEETMKRILTAFGEGFYEELLNAEKPLSAMLSVSDIANVEKLISLHSLQDRPFDFMHSLITTHIIACALEQKHSTTKKDKPSWLNALLEKLNILEFLVQPMKEIISSVGYSQEYICREFKKYTGTTLSKYIRKMKCIHSLSLLEDTDIPIINIATMLYFPDESNYITTFRKIYNVTPGEWRKKVKGK